MKLGMQRVGLLVAGGIALAFLKFCPMSKKPKSETIRKGQPISLVEGSYRKPVELVPRKRRAPRGFLPPLKGDSPLNEHATDNVSCILEVAAEKQEAIDLGRGYSVTEELKDRGCIGVFELVSWIRKILKEDPNNEDALTALKLLLENWDRLIPNKTMCNMISGCYQLNTLTTDELYREIDQYNQKLKRVLFENPNSPFLVAMELAQENEAVAQMLKKALIKENPPLANMYERTDMYSLASRYYSLRKPTKRDSPIREMLLEAYAERLYGLEGETIDYYREVGEGDYYESLFNKERNLLFNMGVCQYVDWTYLQRNEINWELILSGSSREELKKACSR